MSKLSVELPYALERQLQTYIPWGSKGTVVEEVLWQIAERCAEDKGACIYEIIQQANDRSKRRAAEVAADLAKGPR